MRWHSFQNGGVFRRPDGSTNRLDDSGDDEDREDDKNEIIDEIDRHFDENPDDRPSGYMPPDDRGGDEPPPADPPDPGPSTEDLIPNIPGLDDAGGHDPTAGVETLVPDDIPALDQNLVTVLYGQGDGVDTETATLRSH